MSFLSINCLNLSLLSCRDTNWSPPPGQTFTRNPEPPSLTPWLAATPYTCYCCCCCCWWCGEWWCSCRRGWQIRSSAPLKSVHRLVPVRRNRITLSYFFFFIRDAIIIFFYKGHNNGLPKYSKDSFYAAHIKYRYQYQERVSALEGWVATCACRPGGHATGSFVCLVGLG